MGQRSKKKISNRKLVDLNAQWVVWAAFDSAGCRALQAVIAENEVPHHSEILRILFRTCAIQDLYKSPHANFVLQTIVQNAPPFALQPMLFRLQGQVAAMYRHRRPVLGETCYATMGRRRGAFPMFPAWYGSRVAERIVEHATNSHGERFFDELIRDIYDIATSSFGNFVAQTFFEHNLQRRRECALALLPHASALSRTKGWFVLQFSIRLCDADIQQMFAEQLRRENGRGAADLAAADAEQTFTMVTR